MSLLIKVGQDSPRSEAEGQEVIAKASKRGELCVVDFYTQMALEGRTFQIRSGSISAPSVGAVAIADTAAEMCVDAALGLTIIPVYANIAINLGTGTLHEYGLKSTDAASSAGNAFIPLPLKTNGIASRATARVQAAGNVTVAAELVTTTRAHFMFAQPIAAGAWDATIIWQPTAPPTLAGIVCAYMQIAATGTGPSYFATLDFIELPTVNVD